jgi:multidrug efflux pump subunit AcrA (membrane-fusion protein)
MKRKSAVVVLLLMAGAFGLGRWRDRTVTAAHASAGPRILYYHDPMHPSYRSDKPGKAPDCGMDLTPVYASADAPVDVKDAAMAPAHPDAGESNGPAGVKISPEKQQLIGVRLGQVEKSSGAGTFRALGRIVPDEARVFRLTAKVDGWVRQIFPDSTGSLVKKGQPLVAIYSRDFQVAQQAYLFALNQLDRFKDGDEPDAMDRLKLALADALTNLEGMGMSRPQIDEIARTRKILPAVNLVAPAAGFIVFRNISPEQRFDRGMDFYRIVDLSRVWILANVSEAESGYLMPGGAARVSLAQIPGTTFEARVGNVLPQFDPISRTLQVRLEADNPRFTLKPDMYVDLEFAVRTRTGLVVPKEAVIDSGLRKIVYVDRGNGYFQPRTVQTGWRMGDRVQIVDGLQAGEHIVVSGNFLVDSESRMAFSRGHD